MHDAHTPVDSVIHPDGPGGGSPTASGVTTRTVTAALSAFTPLGVDPAGVTGQSVDIINNLTRGQLQKLVRGVPPGPQTRRYGVNGVPDAGEGNLPLGPLVARPRDGGSIVWVNDAGSTATGAAITGVRVTGGACLASEDTIGTSITLKDGWEFAFTLRVATSGSNSGRAWVAVGRRLDGEDYGISVTGTSSGALTAAIEDPRREQVNVTSGAVPRGSLQRMQLIWDAATGEVRWYRNGVASGTPAVLDWAPEVGRGRLVVGNNQGLVTTSSPFGSVHEIALTAAAPDVVDSWEAIGAVDTISPEEARSLRIATDGVLTPAASIGTVEVRYPTAAGEAGEDITVAVGGYRNVTQRFTRLVPGDMPFCPIDVGVADPSESAVLLTAPRYGRLTLSVFSSAYAQGEAIPIQTDGLPTRNYVLFEPEDPAAGATNLPRAATDTIRLQQGGVDGPVTEVTLVEMNRPPRLNGGGEAFGHAADGWVLIPTTRYGYSGGSFPRIDGETVTVTIEEVPAAGEGFIRLSRTGSNLGVGATVAYGDLARLGWSKAGVSSVRPECKLRLRATAPGAPAWVEDHFLRITDAPRPAGLASWDQANNIFADAYTRVRWGARGGDWAGTDGAYGTVPYVTTASITSARTVTIDVTALVKEHGPDFWLATASSGTLTVGRANYTGFPSREPVLRVTGGARAGDYKATRAADNSEGTWGDRYTTPFNIRDSLAMMLGFDNAGTAAQLADATRVELLVVVTGTSSGGGRLQVFRPAPLPPRPGPRVAASPTPAAERADLIFKADTDAEWAAIAGGAANMTAANRCLYAYIPPGENKGIGVLRGFRDFRERGYPVIRVARMMGWHTNYQPADANRGEDPGLSGKSMGPIASLDRDLSSIEVGRGGNSATGYSGYTCRGQRGAASVRTHLSTSPLHRFMAYGDYNYFLSGASNGLTTYGVNPLPRMTWLWIETVHATNSVNQETGRWDADGVYQLSVNGRRYADVRCLQYRVAGNDALWDALWFDEYNGGVDNNRVDRKWPFVIGPTYVVAGGDTPVAPPVGWSAPFVDAEGLPGTTPLAYLPDFV